MRRNSRAALLASGYLKPQMMTTGAGAGSVTSNAAGYALAGFADTAFAWLLAPRSWGKWYWEQVFAVQQWMGFTDDPTRAVQYAGYYAGINAGFYTASPIPWQSSDWSGRANSGNGFAISPGDVLGFALDLDSSPKKATIYVNNVEWMWLSWTGGPTTVWPMFGYQYSTTLQINLGPAGCVYAPPAGFRHL